MPKVNGINGFTQFTADFQSRALLNKAVLDVGGVALPRVLLARNKIELKEILLRQSIVVVAAFVLAPIHAWFFAKEIAKHARFDRRLLSIASDKVTSIPRLKQAIEALKLEIQKRKLPKLSVPSVIDEQFRRKLIASKMNLFTLDIVAEALIFANLGLIRNWFGQLLTGKKQFSGELGVISQNDLDTLYNKRESKENYFKKFRKSIPTLSAIIVPTMLGLGMKRALTRNPNKGLFGVTLKKLAPFFDYSTNYKNLFYFSNGVVILLNILNDTGEILTARSPHEWREILLKNVPVDIIFSSGELFWLSLFKFANPKVFKGIHSFSVQDVINQTKKDFRGIRANTMAKAWWGSFVLSTATLFGVIAFNNRLTTKKLKEEAKTILPNKTQYRSPLTNIDSQYYWPAAYLPAPSPVAQQTA